MTQTITDEQLAQRSELAGPVLVAITFAESHIADLRVEMRDKAAKLPGDGRLAGGDHRIRAGNPREAVQATGRDIPLGR